MNDYKIVSHSPEETQKLGRIIGKLVEPGDVLLLEGKLGAGKTCLTQGIALGLGIDDYILSPTFVIMREFYGRLPLYHMDLYRLDNIEESMDLGLDDYLYGEGLCVIEWAEKALSILPRKHLMMRIEYLSDTERVFRPEPAGDRYEELAGQITEMYIKGNI
ncbi:MAG: tRNA (adenosine(37)-N6)-threonylcarbamoyltransferase complex ATPase subunit type 1 TsaE [Dehalococcoidales bacterium]|nr:tRNA (adenosine(37)-N6)-threonylcarbamoyltransferase complex ATPase subunit type 1 TsaE [Dehalococcoidales bacterium]